MSRQAGGQAQHTSSQPFRAGVVSREEEELKGVLAGVVRWEWLVNAARTALRTRLYSDQEAINARNDSCVPIVESFQKVVNKLTRRDWLLMYQCMGAEFALQCHALRR